MTITMIVAGYLACAAGAFALFVKSWRKKWDVTIKDAVFFAFLSTGGPASLICATFITASDYFDDRGVKPPRILWRRK